MALVNRRLFPKTKKLRREIICMSYERTSWLLPRRAPLKRKNSDNYCLGTFCVAAQLFPPISAAARLVSSAVPPLSVTTVPSFFTLIFRTLFFLSFQNDENFFTQLLSITRAVLLSKRLYLTEFQLLLSFAELFLRHKNSFPRENRHFRRV